VVCTKFFKGTTFLLLSLIIGCRIRAIASAKYQATSTAFRYSLSHGGGGGGSKGTLLLLFSFGSNSKELSLCSWDIGSI
jgi:hypothetical protein